MRDYKMNGRILQGKPVWKKKDSEKYKIFFFLFWNKQETFENEGG